MDKKAGKKKKQKSETLIKTGNEVQQVSEEKLKVAVDQWQTAFDAIKDAVSLIDAEGKIVRCNRAMSDFLGKPPTEIIGRRCWELVHGTSEPIPGCPVVRIKETRQRETLELPIGDKWFEVTADPILDESGGFSGAVHIISDITERKRAEEEVRILQKQIEFILGATKTGLDIIDSDFNVRYIDSEWQKVYGDPTGRKCYEYFMGRSEVCPGCGIPKAIETKIVTVTEEILVKEGNRPIQVTTIPFQNDKGEWLVAEVNVDITERKQAEEALRESEEKFRNISASAKDSIIMIDNEGNITYWNKAAEEIFGYTQEEVLGKEAHTILAHERYHEAFRKGFGIFKETGQGSVIGKTLELSAIKKGGSEFPIELSVSAIKMQGKWHSIGIARDITERKRAEEELKQLKRQLELILQSAGEGILGLDLEGNHTFVNPVAAKQLGYKVEELIALPSHIIWHHSKPDGSPYPTEECPIYAAYKDGTIHSRDDEVFWRKDGTSFPVIYTSTPILEGDKLTGAVVVFRDITERKQAEDEIRLKMREIERLNKLFIGRELRMIELKREVNTLLERLGQSKEYEIPDHVKETGKSG